mmetsp:Transcript_32992/g.50508  ORF Transcript_32992/g.50508 Transcript_32992/m.50508 type:complete len:114 (+) Transcript_32992:1265-1606(+)
MAVLDLFFLQGNYSLFIVGLALVHVIKNQIMSCQSFDDFQKLLKGSKNPVLQDSRLILEKTQKFKNIQPYEIKSFRDHFQQETQKEINEAVDRAVKQEQNKKGHGKQTLAQKK